MWHRLILFLLIADILRFTIELRINQMDFCCSNTCCCSLCTTEQCQLPDQPGIQCRCYNTTNVMCWRFRNFVYKPEPMEMPDKIQLFPVLPEQPVMAQVVPLSTITELEMDPLCCTVGNCPAWIKCKQPLDVKRDQSAFHSIPMPLFIVAFVLFALIIITTIGLCIAASLYINSSYKRQNCSIYDGTEIH